MPDLSQIEAISRQLVETPPPAASLPALSAPEGGPRGLSAPGGDRGAERRSEALARGFSFSRDLEAAHAHWLNGLRSVQARQLQLAVAAERLVDLEQVSPSAAIRRRGELEAEARAIAQLSAQVQEWGARIQAGAVQELRASLVTQIPEWKDIGVAERDVAEMLELATELGLTPEAVNAMAWSAESIVRFRDATKRLRAGQAPRLRSIKGGGKQKVPSGNGGVNRQALNNLASDLHRRGVL